MSFQQDAEGRGGGDILVLQIQACRKEYQQHRWKHVGDIGDYSSGYAGDFVAGIRREIDRYRSREDLYDADNLEKLGSVQPLVGLHDLPFDQGEERVCPADCTEGYL